MSVLVNMFRRQRSDKQRYMTLLRPHIDLMYRMAWRWSGSEADAEDIVQDVLIRLADRVEEMESVDKLRPWLIKIVYRRYVDLYRKRKSSPVQSISGTCGGGQDEQGGDDDSQDLLLQQHPDERDDIGSLQLRETLENALQELDEDQRNAILLHDVEGYSAVEAAEILNTSPGTVKSRLHRARKKVKNFLEAGTF